MIIESRKEYELAVVALDVLMMGEEATADSLKGRWLGMLAAAIEAYEKIHFPIADPTPEEARAFRDSQELHPFKSADGGDTCMVCGTDCGGKIHGHVPTEKMSGIICARCSIVLRER